MNRGTSSRGRGRGSVFRGNRGGFQQRDMGPPDTVLEAGAFVHAVEDEMLCSSVIQNKVPYFNAPIYLQNKALIGRVDEILGPINEVYFSIKMNEGMIASSFQTGDKVYIGSDKLLPIERFLPKPKIVGVAKRGTRGTFRGTHAVGGRGSGGSYHRGLGGARGSRGGIRGFGDRGRGNSRPSFARGSRGRGRT